jgi:ketosteroid isomerase-like protein
MGAIMIISTSALHFIDRVQAYLARLQQADVPGLVALFSPRAVVHSPFLGTLAPRPFFEQLAAATNRSTLHATEVFVSGAGTRRAVACFTYDWELRDGRVVRFPCTDVFEFDEDGDIGCLTIVYDTAPIRDQVGDKYRTPAAST